MGNVWLITWRFTILSVNSVYAYAFSILFIPISYIHLVVINGEKAAYCTPTFAEKRERTLDLLLKSVEQKCTHEVHIGEIICITSTCACIQQ